MTRRTKYLLQLALSVSILVFLLARMDLDQARATIASADFYLILLVIGIYILDRILMAWKWQILLHVISEPVSFFFAVRVYYISCFVGFALPFGGMGPDLVRYAKLRDHGIEGHVILGSIVIERFIGLVAMMLVLVISILVFLYLLGIDFHAESLTLAMLAIAALTGLSCLLLFNERVRSWLLETGRFRHALARVRMDKLYDTLALYRGKQRLIAFNLMLSFVEQLFPVVSFYYAAQAFGVEIGFLQALAIVPLTTLVQRLPISYAGLGIREGAFVVLLGLFGVEFSTALVLSLSLFFVFIVSLMPGFLFSLFDMPELRKHGK